MVFTIKTTAAVALTGLGVATISTVSAAKCTLEQIKLLAGTSPDVGLCTKYYSSEVNPPPADVLCKDHVCKASLARMVKLLPYCEDRGVQARKELEEDLEYCNAFTVSKCTQAEMKKLRDATPDKDKCVKYYSDAEPPSADVLCKEPVCLASMTRLTAILPDCIDDGYRVKKEILDEIAYCAKKTGNSTATSKARKAVPSIVIGVHSA